jgi:predicted Zn finger-like uncharacterized protein
MEQSMPLVIHCPNCASRYEVAEATAGKRVRCKQCQTVFTAEAETLALAPLENNSPLDPLGGVNLAQFPALPAASAPRFSELPSQSAWPSPGSSGGTVRPLEGPSDTQMRLVCAGMIGMGLFLAIGSVIMHNINGTIYLAVIVLIPLMLVLGPAGLISPNVVRACGKYGGHLPWQYKAAGWGVMGLSFVLMILLGIGLLAPGL